jgi:hypothetical protein
LAEHIDRAERQKIYTGFLVSKPLGKEPLKTLRRKFEDNIKTDFRKIAGFEIFLADKIQIEVFWVVTHH